MIEKLRVAVVGCGAISMESHIPVVCKSQYTSLAAVVDKDLEWAKNVSRQFNAPFATDDYTTLIGHVDAAVIATPNNTHAEISCFLLENGIHVLCEKPVAVSSDEARNMFDTAEKHGARLMVGQSRRFSPQLRFLWELLDEGFLLRTGELSASLGGNINAWPARTGYRLNRNLSGGGVMMDSGVHLIDLALWLFDDVPIKVEYEESQTNHWGVEDDAWIVLHFSKGGRARLAVSFTHGLNGQVRYSIDNDWVKTVIEGNPIEFYIESARLCRKAGVQQPVLASSDDTFNIQMNHFCQSIIENKPFLVRQDQILLGLEIIEACYLHKHDFSWEER